MIDKIVLGTVQFGLNYGINNTTGKMSEQEVFKILNFAHEKGVHILDTAAAYGNSEERIGKFLQLYVERDFRIITKLNLKPNVSPIQSLDRSLQNLKVDQVDTVMFHSFDDYKATKSQDINAFLDLKGGRFKKMGISLYTNEQIDEICETDLFEVVQIPFNALDNERLRGDHLKKLKDRNIETHTRSVFLQGLFFMEMDRIPNKLEPLAKYLGQIDEIAIKFKVKKSELALHYAFSKKYIDYVLIGIDSLEQLRKNLEALRITVPGEAIKALSDIRVDESSLLNPISWNR